MPIHRLPKTGNFTQIQNEALEDPRLSWEAKGLHHYLLSKPDDWDPRLHDVLNHGPAGEAKIRRMHGELRRYGYERRQRIRLPDGRFTWITHIFEWSTTSPPPSPHSKARKKPG